MLWLTTVAVSAPFLPTTHDHRLVVVAVHASAVVHASSFTTELLHPKRPLCCLSCASTRASTSALAMTSVTKALTAATTTATTTATSQTAAAAAAAAAAPASAPISPTSTDFFRRTFVKEMEIVIRSLAEHRVLPSCVMTGNRRKYAQIFPSPSASASATAQAPARKKKTPPCRQEEGRGAVFFFLLLGKRAKVEGTGAAAPAPVQEQLSRAGQGRVCAVHPHG